MEKIILNPHGAAHMRNYFERDVCFKDDRDDTLTKIVEAYEKAAHQATRSARSAISTGLAEFAHNALWDECIAETLEHVLSLFPSSCPDSEGCFLGGSECFTPPERPHFKP